MRNIDYTQFTRGKAPLKTRKAFTLIEMLVVFGIIAVLAAILTSTLVYGIGYSRNSTCESNLHQIQVAMTLYEQDSDAFPPYIFCDMAGTFEKHFEQSRQALQPYAKTDKIYDCPDDPYFDRYNPYLFEKTETSYSETLAAFACGHFLDVPIEDRFLGVLRSSDVPKPSTCGLVTDYGYVVKWHPPTMGTAHGTFDNVVYVDGHIKHIHVPHDFDCK